MRNALTLLVAAAVVLAVAGALNHGVLVDIDYLAGTVTAVSLFWVALVTAAVVLVTGGVAALLARSGLRRTLVSLESELQSTYERLRAAEAKVPAAVAAGPGAPAEAPAPAPPAEGEDEATVATAAASLEASGVTAEIPGPEAGAADGADDLSAAAGSTPQDESPAAS